MGVTGRAHYKYTNTNLRTKAALFWIPADAGLFGDANPVMLTVSPSGAVQRPGRGDGIIRRHVAHRTERFAFNHSKSHN